MAIEQEVVSITTTGGAGVSAGTGFTNAINGYLEDIFLDWNASAPATADVTVSLEGRGGNVIAISNSVTDVFVAPRVKPVDNANAAIANASEKFALNGRIQIAVAQSNDLSPSLVAYVRYSRAL